MPVQLNPHQHRIMQWKLENKTNAEIARLLKIKECTVKFHLGKIYDILGAPGGRHAALRYFEYRKAKGLSPLPSLYDPNAEIIHRFF